MKYVLLLVLLCGYAYGESFLNEQVHPQYSSIYKRALAGNTASIHRFLRHAAKTDGAYSEEYGGHALRVFTKIGDKTMANILRRHDQSLKSALLTPLAHELSNEAKNIDGFKELKRRFPRSYKELNRR